MIYDFSHGKEQETHNHGLHRKRGEFLFSIDECQLPIDN
jgi:hypothetical protein